MDQYHSLRSARSAPVLIATSALLLFLVACGPGQSATIEAVNVNPTPTRAAVLPQADAVATSVAATIAAAQPPAVPATAEPTAAGAAAAVCPFAFDDLTVRSSGYLEGGRFLATLQRQERFPDPAYILMINGLPYPCTPIAGQPENRVYCVGSPLPPVGQATVQLLAGDGSCEIKIPFNTMNVPPVPQPTRPAYY